MDAIHLDFGEGKVLISPVSVHGGKSAGIAFSTKLGSGKVGENHPTIIKGDDFDETEHDVVLVFTNKESLDVLQWAIEEAYKILAGK